ncbi:unnamed protein product [Parascedosporium putredinis]|uniref:Eukaryotic translation initiation factor 2A n=1 Tax=Parascedosporium putredinis TaxID=1442378 RepID=A0A9P1MAN7_9PEZI|nr:unnamed protein product [Parascedosporium putredinis]CAI7994689.1 unnamed protein product [Parascedosporium putredinis]
MALPLQFAYRTQKAVGLVDVDPVYQPVLGLADVNCRCSQYSPCGRWFAWATTTDVNVSDASTGNVVLMLPLSNVYELSFSPKGTFVSTWERPSKDEAGDATKNLKVWRVEQAGESTPVGQFVQKQQDGWTLNYTSDEKYCARLVTNEVQLYQSDDLQTVWNKLRVEGVRQFSLGPGQLRSVAVYVPQRQGFPAAVKIFDVSNFTTPIAQKSFFKSDKVKLEWNSQGTSLLVEALTDVDKSNKSYYGETTLYLLSAKGDFDARVTLDKDGPIHDVAWSPNSKEFGVVYGYMPAKTTIFNHRAIDIYDMERDFRKLCTIESGNPSICEWSADSRFLMTATLSLVFASLELGPDASPSATTFLGTVKTPSKPADEGGAAHIMTSTAPTASGHERLRTAPTGVPGAETVEQGSRQVPGADAADGDESLSKAALKNKKRRGRKAKGEGGGQNGGAEDGPAGGAGQGGSGATLAPAPKQPECRRA